LSIERSSESRKYTEYWSLLFERPPDGGWSIPLSNQESDTADGLGFWIDVFDPFDPFDPNNLADPGNPHNPHDRLRNHSSDRSKTHH
jgi:hypothetical protein